MPDDKPIQSAETASDAIANRLSRKAVSRRSVLKLGALAAAALPLVITLAPTEARAQDSLS